MGIIEVTDQQLYGWIALYFWPFLRLLGLFTAAPVFGEQALPVKVKVGLAATLAFVIAPSLPTPPAVAPASYAGLMIVVQQVLIGVAMGFVMKVIFTTAQAAGEYIGLQMGLSFASFFTPGLGSSNVLSRFLHTIAILLCLSFNVHLLLIELLSESFVLLPIGSLPLHGEGWWKIATLGGFIFSAGLSLSMPIITALLLINLAMAILNRAAPQFSVYSVGFAITLLSGLLLMTTLSSAFGGLYARFFEVGLRVVRETVTLLAGH